MTAAVSIVLYSIGIERWLTVYKSLMHVALITNSRNKCAIMSRDIRYGNVHIYNTVLIRKVYCNASYVIARSGYS